MQLLTQQIQIESLTSMMAQILKQLAAQGEGSCKQDHQEQEMTTMRISVIHMVEGESGAGNVEGYRRKGKQVMYTKVSSDVTTERGAGDENEKLERLIDLDDDIFIDNWASD
ncbi:hypothetical protein L1987_13578 [Smallanthus sonchifolius]|uniref:Uncharacterized protein n=1 Tax=Smallanthus sonchifolius TaxID=185202 RepID=A0ACB9JIZ6_9ASTR|nr:hypothetical protein L1987_13578 [Smallanthus sonchifolius]